MKPHPHSYYCIACVCGHDVESTEPVFHCPHCKRELVLEWRIKLPTPAPIAQPAERKAS